MPRNLHLYSFWAEEPLNLWNMKHAATLPNFVCFETFLPTSILIDKYTGARALVVLESYNSWRSMGDVGPIISEMAVVLYANLAMKRAWCWNANSTSGPIMQIQTSGEGAGLSRELSDDFTGLAVDFVGRVSVTGWDELVALAVFINWVDVEVVHHPCQRKCTELLATVRGEFLSKPARAANRSR